MVKSSTFAEILVLTVVCAIAMTAMVAWTTYASFHQVPAPDMYLLGSLTAVTICGFLFLLVQLNLKYEADRTKQSRRGEAQHIAQLEAEHGY